MPFGHSTSTNYFPTGHKTRNQKQRARLHVRLECLAFYENNCMWVCACVFSKGTEWGVIMFWVFRPNCNWPIWNSEMFFLRVTANVCCVKTSYFGKMLIWGVGHELLCCMEHFFHVELQFFADFSLPKRNMSESRFSLFQNRATKVVQRQEKTLWHEKDKVLASQV